jgi:hypothetical protein
MPYLENITALHVEIKTNKQTVRKIERLYRPTSSYHYAIMVSEFQQTGSMYMHWPCVTYLALKTAIITITWGVLSAKLSSKVCTTACS